MSQQVNEAIARYHKLLESDTFKDLSWAEALQDRMRTSHLTMAGRTISPVLRPHFVTQRQYTNLAKTAELLYSSIDRVEKLALSTPSLMSRMEMLPAEKMLASVDPGYSYMAVTSMLDGHLNNGSLHFVGYTADTPTGVIFGEALNNIFYDAPPVKEFRKRYNLTKLGTTKPFMHALLKAYKEFGGKKVPNIAILEFRNQYQASDSGEYQLLTDLFRREGYRAEIVSPDQLEYRNGVLRRGDFEINLVYRRVRVSEFLVRFDLNHPLVRAYREHAVCVVNSFRSELAQKRAIFDLLTDESITGSFPAAEKKTIRELIPWTRVVANAKTMYKDQTVDLPDFITRNREKLVLRANDDATDRQTFVGSEMTESAWDGAIKTATRNRYVVQEVVPPARFTFPLHRWGGMEYQELKVDVQPHSFLGRVNGCSSWLSPLGSGFSTISGLAPTFLLEPK